ncbi:ABC transporter permease [Salinifilum ghardaiensis]
MGGLVRAEIRKIATTHLWWALLVPVTVLSFLAGWLGTALGTLNELEQAFGGTLPLGLLTVSMATNFSTIFAALFGAMAVSGEHWNRSITTTFLTGNPRGAVLGAKLLVYAGAGLVYGLVNVLCSSIGALVGAGLEGFGRPLDWFTVGGAGVLVMILWTLLGVGLGALIANSVASIFVLLLYRFPVESMLASFLTSSGNVTANAISAYLPASAAGGVVGNIAVPVFLAELSGTAELPGSARGSVPPGVVETLHLFAGGSSGHPWWASLLTFAAYTAAIVLLGWAASRRRDVL